MISVTQKGDFKNLEMFLKKKNTKWLNILLNHYGKVGVDALSAVTPKDTGRTASSWSYKIEPTSNGVSLVWTNSNVNKGVNIAIILQYGHGTRNGGYVAGRDYINPAMRPVFDEIAKALGEELKK